MNNKITFIIMLILITSCEKVIKNNDTISLKTNYLIDTVFIDAGDEILYLKWGLITSDIGKGERFLYNYNNFDHSIEQIDLAELKLTDKFYFEKEGPNGTGSYVSSINIINTDSIFISARNKSGIYKLNGNVITRFDWNNSDIKKGEISQDDFRWFELSIPGYNDLVFAITKNDQTKSVSLKKLDMKKKSISEYQIDPNRNYENYTVELTGKDQYGFIDPYIFVSPTDGKVLISHEFSNEIYTYSPDKDTLEAILYKPKLTPSKVSLEDIKKPNSAKEFNETYQHFLEQVRFGVPVWDKVNKKYYRLSAYKKFGEEREEGAILPEVIKSNVILSVFDEKFNLLGEIPIPELNSERSKYFVREGKLWVFLNVEDELAFIRLSLFD